MKKAYLLFAAAAALCLSLGSVAFAQDGAHRFQVDLAELNGSGSSGTATITQNGNQLTVDVDSTGLTPNQPHAQHIHGGLGMVSECPTIANDEDGDGLINTMEGQPSYGEILTSITTEGGDTSADSGLAVERFPVADENGNLSYSRTFTVPEDVAANLDDFAIVQHGIDLNGNGEYDGDAESSLDPSLPLEAAIPANCGEIEQMVMPDTGGFSPLSPALAGGAAMILLGTGIFLARRRT